MDDRIPCVVPFCRRTIKRQENFHEYICANHWRYVPRKYRQLYFAAKRKFKKDWTKKNWQRQHRIWEKLKQIAMMRGL